MNKLLVVLGVVILICPVFLRYCDSQKQSDIIATYEDEINKMNASKIQESLREAKEYNATLYIEGWIDKQAYWALLNLQEQENGIMGSIHIPKIQVRLPILHGTSEEVLATSVGHMWESSLPVGGQNTHSVLTGHRGLPNAELFTRLDELEEGDKFYLSVCKEKLIYMVTDIQVVEPESVESIAIQEGRDLVSLITCTPYGLNTHRLIVTGERVPESVQVVVMDPLKPVSKWNVIPCVLAGVGVSAVIVRARLIRRRKRRETRYERYRKSGNTAARRAGRNALLHKSGKHAGRGVRTL